MESEMKPSLRLSVIAAVTLGVASLTSTASSAQIIGGNRVALYDVVYYSDASKTTEVGRNYGVCYGGWGTPIWAGSSEFTSGQQTAFHSQEHVGWCTPEGIEYF
jgi:hypothetical protein